MWYLLLRANRLRRIFYLVFFLKKNFFKVLQMMSKKENGLKFHQEKFRY